MIFPLTQLNMKKQWKFTANDISRHTCRNNPFQDSSYYLEFIGVFKISDFLLMLHFHA